jgi:hypothetical protein
MKNFTLVVFGALILLGAPRSFSQNYVFSSFDCNPFSCTDTGPLATESEVAVAWDGTCTGGILQTIGGQVTGIVGYPTACSTPYKAVAEAMETQSTYYEEVDCEEIEYYVDYVTPVVTIYSVLGTSVYTAEGGTAGCDGSETDGTKYGTKPC